MKYATKIGLTLLFTGVTGCSQFAESFEQNAARQKAFDTAKEILLSVDPLVFVDVRTPYLPSEYDYKNNGAKRRPSLVVTAFNEYTDEFCVIFSYEKISTDDRNNNKELRMCAPNNDLGK